jgi:hypothetical protein
MALGLHQEEESLSGRGIMSIDGPMLVIAFLALSLKLLLWAREADGVEVEDELHRQAVFQLDGAGCDFARKHTTMQSLSKTPSEFK